MRSTSALISFTIAMKRGSSRRESTVGSSWNGCEPGRYPAHWVEDVGTSVKQRQDAFHEAWRQAAREGPSGIAEVAGRLQPVLRETLRDVLLRRFPDAAVLRDDTPGRAEVRH